MLCALTVRRLKPGAFDEFRSKFNPLEREERPPEGWTAFHMLRNPADQNEVITFGFFDGTRDELERNQEAQGYRERVDEIAALVESVVVNGVYDFEIAVHSAAAR